MANLGLQQASSNFVNSYMMGKQVQAERAEQEKQNQIKSLMGGMLMGQSTPEQQQQFSQLAPTQFVNTQNYLQGQAANKAAAVDALDDKRSRSDLMQLASTNDEVAQNQILDQRIADITAGGGDPSDTQQLRSMPFAQRQNWIQMKASDLKIKMPGAAGEVDIGTYNPRDYTVDSFAKFAKSNDPAVLVRYSPMKETKVGGITYFADDNGQLFLPVVQDDAGNIVEATPKQVESGDASPAPEPLSLSVDEQIKQQADLAAAKTTATETAKLDVKLSATDQKAFDSAQTSLGTIQKMLDSPALTGNVFTGALGLGSATPPIPGTPEANFRAFHETLKSQQFLNEITKMKGMGSLSNAEGMKVAAAAKALELNMSPEEYKRSITEIKEVLGNIKPPGTYDNEDDAPIMWEDLQK